ncbi:MAG: hypothetical protein M1483_00425 [Actinobacteria bacterium]|nr:hypothetical protein [Actinomycetota bacterium]MCL6104101.1 hypothetical protein [Actinomycetota bacterium]
MSYKSQGVGWWQASDGNWYPPELHPDPEYRSSVEHSGGLSQGRLGRLKGLPAVIKPRMLVLAAVVVIVGVTAGLIVVDISNNNSPQAVVSDFLHAAQSGPLTKLCTYVKPDTQKSCVKGLTVAESLGVKTPLLTGSVSLGDVVTNGNFAVVVVTGHFCNNKEPGQSPSCMSNSNPEAGITGVSFKSALSNAVINANSSTLDESPDVPCVKINGKWYLDV